MQNFNSTTSEIYSENNQDFLEEHKAKYGLSSCEWAGFRQWKKAGRSVKKGEKGCKILKLVEKTETNAAGEEENCNYVVALYVFNKEQTKEL